MFLDTTVCFVFSRRLLIALCTAVAILSTIACNRRQTAEQIQTPHAASDGPGMAESQRAPDGKRGCRSRCFSLRDFRQ